MARYDGNAKSFLDLISYAEGTLHEPDPYRVVFGKGYIIKDLRDHPAITGEWKGRLLSVETCRRAGQPSGCRSTAAGAYQIIKGTWSSLKSRLLLPGFYPKDQDRAAWGLVEACRADQLVLAGKISLALAKCSTQWASLPGNKAGQPQKKLAALLEQFRAAGGTIE